MKVLVVLANGFEEIETMSIIDILRRANIDTVVAGLESKAALGAHGVKVEADTLLKKVLSEEFDVIVLPGGGEGTQNLLKSEQLKSILLDFDKQKKQIAAICAAPLVLAEHGILKNRKATSFPGVPLKDALFSEAVLVEDEHILTSRGPATAPYFALKLVEKLKSAEEASKIKKDMLFDLI